MRLFWILITIICVGTILLMITGGSGETLGIDNDKFAGFVWLTPILVLISAGVLQGRYDLGNFFKSLLIWAAIFLVISAAYVFRYDFQEVGARVFGGLIPGIAITTTTNDGRQQVVIGKRRDGHFTANVVINGETISMLVDSGASRVTLTSEDAKRAGLDTSSLRYTMTVQTANGSAMAAPINLDEIAIGPIRRQNIKAMITTKGKLNESLLGMSFLSTLTSVNMKADELRLTD